MFITVNSLGVEFIPRDAENGREYFRLMNRCLDVKADQQSRTRTSARRTLPLALVLWAGAAGWGASPVAPVNINGKGLALKGYDAVAYFEQDQAVKGSPQHFHQWMDSTWRFSSKEHGDRFAADPERYAPQYGGYCAWAVSQGATAPIDPKAWTIVDGKLYLNYNRGVQKQWRRDAPARIEEADRHWPRLHR